MEECHAVTAACHDCGVVLVSWSVRRSSWAGLRDVEDLTELGPEWSEGDFREGVSEIDVRLSRHNLCPDSSVEKCVARTYITSSGWQSCECIQQNFRAGGIQDLLLNHFWRKRCKNGESSIDMHTLDLEAVFEHWALEFSLFKVRLERTCFKVLFIRESRMMQDCLLIFGS